MGGPCTGAAGLLVATGNVGVRECGRGCGLHGRGCGREGV